MHARREVGQLKSQLVAALRENAWAISEQVAQAFESMPKWHAEAQNYPGSRGDYLALQFKVFPDYAAEYFSRSDPVFMALFIGELIKALYVPHTSEKQAHDDLTSVLSALRDRLSKQLGELLPADSMLPFSAFFDEVTRTLTMKSDKVQHVLFVGDCLYLDIVPFTVADLLAQGIRLVPDYASSKNPVMLRDELRGFSSRKYDLVFFSPFTYEFSLEYNQLLLWKNAAIGATSVHRRVARAWEDTRGTIDILADLFDCPIHIHNSAAIMRDDSRFKRTVKNFITTRNRRRAQQFINEKLASYIRLKNAQVYEHLFLLDEARLVNEFGELKSGAYLYKSALQHPALLGQVLGREYVDVIYVNAWLLKKKVVVCDLDNTLWDGVIGEAPVTHYHDRQQALKALKDKGVVLAINSKNDPANVHWRHGTLSEADFVCSAISWEPKVHGMKLIQSELDLKIKDYVFIDDREDERQLIHESYPETLCLDATDSRNWKRIALWARFLPQDEAIDRTLMYKQREQRKAFVQEDVSSPEERAALFRKLELRLTIERSRTADLKRIAELINRTNQFNLEGSRTSLREVTAWHGSPDHLILLGRTRDRFGDMGTTCVAVVGFSESEMRILLFVLSCRVFGYGIEHAVMNHLKRIARERGVQRIVGRYQQTPQNSPCKGFLPENGFKASDDIWSIGTDVPSPPDPGWLAIEIEQRGTGASALASQPL